MAAGYRERLGGQKAIYGIDRAAGDDGNRTIQRRKKGTQSTGKVGRNLDRVRAGSDFDERAIEIEEQSHRARTCGQDGRNRMVHNP